MSYTKNTWQSGDIVSSEKLNHMEDGIAEAGGLPEYSASDAGKVLTVVADVDVVVQEQTVALNGDGMAYFQEGTYDFSSWDIGDVVTVTADNVSYECEIEEFEGVAAVLFTLSEIDYAIVVPPPPDNVPILVIINGEYDPEHMPQFTISVTKGSGLPVLKWKEVASNASGVSF